jgi:histidine triad (HIT) family protein
MADTIFSKILRREIPCHKIYEDDQLLAFLDVNPLSRGHALIIPKEAAQQLHELSAESAAAIGRVLPKICRAVMRVTGASDYNVLQNNGTLAHQVVMHVHFHIIPKYADGTGLGLRWSAGAVDGAAAADLAAKIADELAL